MAKLLTTRGIAFFFDELFKSSKQYVYIVSPYIKIEQQLKERILEAVHNGLKVTLIYGKDRKQINSIASVITDKIEILYYENLHAKFYINEKHLLVTSMNLHSYSEANNREVGVLFSKTDNTDLKVIEDCYKEYESIKRQAINIKSGLKNGSVESVISPIIDSFFQSLSEVENYKDSEFHFNWNNYIKKNYSEINFSSSLHLITVKDFPLPEIEFSTEYGFATFRLKVKEEKLIAIKEKELPTLKKALKGYRLYWTSVKKISLYPKKDISFKNLGEHIKYCAKGLKIILAELKRIFNN